jgi:signal transduction histidine kinase
VLRQDQNLALSVADTGIGIACDDIPKALERFGQIDTDLSRKYDGVGLGLPLAQYLTELHGGALHMESEPGIGTNVTVVLPAARIVSGHQKKAVNA